MTIAIDVSRAVNEKAGVGKYTKNLVENLLKIDTEDDFLLFFNFWRNYKTKKQQAEIYKQAKTQIYCSRFPGLVKEGILRSHFGFYGKKLAKAQLFLAPTFLDIDLSLKIPQVVVIHDLSMFLFPQHLGQKKSDKYQQITKLACAKAQKIIAVSYSTKKDLTKILKVPEKKITVIYPGLIKFTKIAQNLPNNLKPKTYILTVGTVEPRKNLKNLLTAYSLLPMALKEKYPLVIVGAYGWNVSQDLKEVKDIKNIIILGYIANDELAKLYKEARVFVYPSLYEGFGLPIIEAMQFGTPVITSNISSMPEVAGKAGILIDPKDPKNISQAIQNILEEKIDRNKLVKLSKDQANKFFWQDTAQETLKVMQDIVVEKNIHN